MPDPATLTAQLAALLAERDALDSQRSELKARIAQAREALRIARVIERQAEGGQPPASPAERSHARLALIRRWIEAGESADAIARRLTVGLDRARVLIRQAKGLRRS